MEENTQKPAKKGMAGWLKVVIAVVVVAAIGAVGYFGATGDLFQGSMFKRPTVNMETLENVRDVRVVKEVKDLTSTRDFAVVKKDELNVTLKDIDNKMVAVEKPVAEIKDEDTSQSKTKKVIQAMAFQNVYGFGAQPSEVGKVAEFTVLSADLSGGSLYDFEFNFTGCIGDGRDDPVGDLYLVKENIFNRTGFSIFDLEDMGDYVAFDKDGNGRFSLSEFQNLAGIDVPGDYVVVMDTTNCIYDNNMPDIGTVDFVNPQNTSSFDTRLIFG